MAKDLPGHHYRREDLPMARTPTPRPPAGTPDPFDPAALLALMQAQGETMTAINRRCARIEAQIAQASDRQADAEKRQDDRITKRMAQLQLRVVSTTERALEAAETLTTEIRKAGEDARREMNRTSRLAHMLMERVETAAYHRMREMRDTATEIASNSQTAITATIETIQSEASTLMQAMRNAAVGAVSTLGADTTRAFKQAETRAIGAIENAATTAKRSITNTALAAGDGFKTATKDAEQLAQLNVAAAATFETCMAGLRKIGPALTGALERRTWQIARATGLHTAISLGLGAALYHGVLWYMSARH